MKHINLKIFLITVIFSSCSSQYNDGIVKVDTNKNYPLLDIKLSDIADVDFIPLQPGKDSFYFVNGSVTRQIYIMKDKIILGDSNEEDPKLLVYDFIGEPLYKIGEIGRGPGEFSGSFSFVVDTLSNEIIVWPWMEKSFLVYDINGQFKWKKNVENKGIITFYNMDIIGDYIMGYNPRSLVMASDFLKAQTNKNVLGKGRKTLMFFDRLDLTLKDISDITYAKPEPAGYTILNSLLTTKDGDYLSCFRSDTIYFVDRHTRISAKFIDITQYSHDEIGVIPVAETKKYIFLTTHKLMNSVGDIKYFAYDKQSNKIYRLNNSIDKEDNFRLALLNDNVAFNQWTFTLNSNYAAYMFSATFLRENLKSLPKNLAVLAEELQEMDNPILMLISFK